MLGVTIQDLGETAVLRCVGRIVAGREANTLREAVLSTLKPSATRARVARTHEFGFGIQNPRSGGPSIESPGSHPID